MLNITKDAFYQFLLFIINVFLFLEILILFHNNFSYAIFFDLNHNV